MKRIRKESVKMPAESAGCAGKMLLAACMAALLLSSGGFRNPVMASETETEMPAESIGASGQDTGIGNWSVPVEKIEEARALDTSHVADASDMTTVEELEESGVVTEKPAPAAKQKEEPANEMQMGLFGSMNDQLLEEIKALDVNTLTPLEALTKLYEIKKRIV